MNILLKIALTQIILLFANIFILHPSSPLANKLEKWFDRYVDGLNFFIGVHLLGLFITGIIAIWTSL